MAHSQRVASCDQARPSSGPPADETLSLPLPLPLSPSSFVQSLSAGLLASGLNTMDEEGKIKCYFSLSSIRRAGHQSIRQYIYFAYSEGGEGVAAAKNRSIRSFDSFSIFFISVPSATDCNCYCITYSRPSSILLQYFISAQ